MSYYVPRGGHPGQHELTTDRAVFTEAYAVLPRGTMRDIVVSHWPHWRETRGWILARPLRSIAAAPTPWRSADRRCRAVRCRIS